MATRKDFQQLANGLINGTFKDFLKPVTLTMGGSFDYDTQEITGGTTINTKGIRLSYQAGEFQNQAIQSGDIKLIIENTFTDKIRTDDTILIFDGEELDIIDVSLDPADATYTIQARPK